MGVADIMGLLHRLKYLLCRWYLWHGSWWMVQACFDGWLSLGVHVDPRSRRTGRTNIPYGPYIDIHFFCFVFSFGRNPVYSGTLEAESSLCRGGRRGDDF